MGLSLTDHYDALIIGGGPAGSAAAILLCQAGWSVLLVERKPFPRRKVCGEYLSATNWPLLKRLGVEEAFAANAGPSIRRAAIVVGTHRIEAALPQPVGAGSQWGRALSRQVFDTMLLDRAIECGADVRQPWRCTTVNRHMDRYECQLVSQDNHESQAVSATGVIAAHGSWETGPLSTQFTPTPSKPSDLLAFKAHFRGTKLPADLMPLLSFADGYGGMVHCEQDMVSLSCCLRRTRLEQLPRHAGEQAGEAVLEHIRSSCPALDAILDGATREESWLSAGPIRPGIRRGYRDGIFVVGNAAGEAHPVVAEGISMAMQSTWILTRLLIPRRGVSSDRNELDRAGRLYETDWKKSFAPRIRAAAVVAHGAMHPAFVSGVMHLLRCCPDLLTWGARLCGKASVVVPDVHGSHIE